MLRQQAQMVVSAATQPVLLQVAQEAQARELMDRIQQLQDHLMKDPEAMRALEDLMRHFQPPSPPEDH
jgi:ribosomal protein S15P/S13E